MSIVYVAHESYLQVTMISYKIAVLFVCAQVEDGGRDGETDRAEYLRGLLQKRRLVTRGDRSFYIWKFK